jgi:hypothetical protein
MAFDNFFFRQYGVATTVRFGLRASNATNALPPQLTSAPSLVAGESQISKDGGAFINTTNLPTGVGNGVYALSLTAAEMQASNIMITIRDATGPAVWIDHLINIETFLGLRTLTINNEAGTAVDIQSSGGNGDAVKLAGNGTGHGIQSTGGATGDGARFNGGATSGDGIDARGVGSGHGLACLGVAGNDGINATGGTTGMGIRGVGGATSGEGIRGQATAGNSAGIAGAGQGTGAGLYGVGGATGPGLLGQGGATSGSGAWFAAQTSGSGLLIQSVGANAALRIIGTGTHGVHVRSGAGSSHAVFCEADSTGDGDGVRCQGKNAGHGFNSIGGATGHGIFGQGGATSGDGVRGAATGGTNAGFFGQGTGAGFGMKMVGGATGRGAEFLGGATSGTAVRMAAQAGVSHGLDIAATGSGTALRAIAAATGSGAVFHGDSGDVTFGAPTGAAWFINASGGNIGLSIVGATIGMKVNSTGGDGVEFSGVNGLRCSGSTAGILAEGQTVGVGFIAQGGSVSGDGAQFTTQGGNSHAILAQGFGSGNGVIATGGDTGNGFHVRGGATSGHGISAFAQGVGNGVNFLGAGAGHGIYAKAGTSGHGLLGQGGSVTGNGIRAEGLAGNSSGLYGLGQGTGHGFEGSPDVFPLTAAFWDEAMGAEPTVALADNPTFRQFFHMVSVLFFNRVTQTAATRTYYKNDGTTVIATQPWSFDGTTQVQGKQV